MLSDYCEAQLIFNKSKFACVSLLTIRTSIDIMSSAAHGFLKAIRRLSIGPEDAQRLASVLLKTRQNDAHQ